jgi:hypothetical protein
VEVADASAFVVGDRLRAVSPSAATGAIISAFFGESFVRSTTAATRTAAIPVTHGAARHIGLRRAAGTAGITFAGTSSSAPRMRVDAAMSPRASATVSAHCRQPWTCDSAARDCSASSAPSSQAWIVPSSR